jgi:hypothetical protein
MIEKTKNVLKDLENSISSLQHVTGEPILKAQQSFELSKRALSEVKIILTLSRFPNTTDEIEFFKHVQPAIISKTIYYCLAHRYYQKLTGFCNDKQIKQMCKKCLELIDAYYSENQTFITYYKSDTCDLDEYYFLRNRVKNFQILDESLAFIEPEFSTGYDLIAARFLAYTKLRKFYTNELFVLKTKQKTPYISTISEMQNKTTWTEKKIGLIEIIYAIHTAGCINNGNCELDDIAKSLERCFNIQLGNIYTTYQEICERKNPTQQLDILIKALKSKVSDRFN